MSDLEANSVGAATLLERERELAELDRALEEVQKGRGRVVVVEASAGLGKTSLLGAVCASATEMGFTCLKARATELERGFAYGCVRQLLEPIVATRTSHMPDDLFDGAAALSQPLFTPTGVEIVPGPPDRSFSMLHGLYWLLNNFAERQPVALVVDDLHWSDAESLRFLNYLLPRLDGLSAIVVASTRGGDRPADVARLMIGPDATVLRPAPLSLDATATLCERLLGTHVERGFATACREATGGNPFFLAALLRDVAERGLAGHSDEAARVLHLAPAAVTEAILLRLSGASASAGALVRAVAVLGDGASISEAAAMTNITEDEAAAAADELAGLDILTWKERLGFAHPIVGEAVRADIGRGELAIAHAAAISILEASGASAERVAAQIVEAEPIGDTRRVELLRRVADDALARGAPAAAVAWLERAMAEPPPPETMAGVLLELGSNELRVGAGASVPHLRQAVASSDDPRQLAMAARRLAIALTTFGDAEAAVAALEPAIDVVASQDREQALLLEGEVWSHAVEASLETRVGAGRRLERLAEGLDLSTPGRRLVFVSLACKRARESATARDAAACLERAVTDGRFVGDQRARGVMPGLSFDLLLGLISADALDVADALIEQLLVHAREQAATPVVAYVTGRRGLLALRRGAIAHAEADARTALELLTLHRVPLTVPFLVSLVVQALVERGETEAAERTLRDRVFDAAVPPGPPTTFLLEARGRLRLAQGRYGDAFDDLVEFGRRVELGAIGNPLASRWRSDAALARAALGDNEQARELALDDLERGRRWGTARSIGVALRAVALADDRSDPIVTLQQAVEVLERSPGRLEHARALTDLGAALRRANRRSEARGVLEDALELAIRCDAGALAERNRVELRAAGGRSRVRRVGGPGALTASERRIAEMAAAGHSNPEIAQALFVTRKTVETHLGHVYRKLGITGRGKLARALTEGAAPDGRSS